MKEKYLYNSGTHTIHIVGYCHHTKGKNTGFIPFNTEDDILAYDGRGARMCALCQKEREKRTGR